MGVEVEVEVGVGVGRAEFRSSIDSPPGQPHQHVRRICSAS